MQNILLNKVWYPKKQLKNSSTRRHLLFASNFAFPPPPTSSFSLAIDKVRSSAQLKKNHCNITSQLCNVTSTQIWFNLHQKRDNIEPCDFTLVLCKHVNLHNFLCNLYFFTLVGVKLHKQSCTNFATVQCWKGEKEREILLLLLVGIFLLFHFFFLRMFWAQTKTPTTVGGRRRFAKTISSRQNVQQQIAEGWLSSRGLFREVDKMFGFYLQREREWALICLETSFVDDLLF